MHLWLLKQPHDGETMQQTFDRVQLGSLWQQWGMVESPQLAQFLWAPGPTIRELHTHEVSYLKTMPRYGL